jgi:hypothetical protein
MKKFHLRILAGHSSWTELVEAEYFDATNNKGDYKGYYAFRANKEIVACYPIERTIIEKIIKIEEND